MTKAVLFITLAFLALCHTAWPLPTAPHEQIGDLLISPSAVQTTKTDGRYTAPPGFHYVRVAVAVRNVGNKAICTYLSAHLGTSLSGGRKLGSMTLKARNGAQTVIGGSINQLLPGEDADGYIMFDDLRDGIEPESLSIESDQQKRQLRFVELRYCCNGCGSFNRVLGYSGIVTMGTFDTIHRPGHSSDCFLKALWDDYFLTGH